MARVILDVPKEKMQVFLMLVMQLGMQGFTEPITSGDDKHNQHPYTYVKQSQQAKHPYYDWEFYNNELEFE
jgi:hypothetical protein